MDSNAWRVIWKNAHGEALGQEAFVHRIDARSKMNSMCRQPFVHSVELHRIDGTADAAALGVGPDGWRLVREKSCA